MLQSFSWFLFSIFCIFLFRSNLLKISKLYTGVSLARLAAKSAFSFPLIPAWPGVHINFALFWNLMRLFLIWIIRSELLLGLLMALSTERLSVQITCLPRRLLIVFRACRIAKASAVKIEENSGRMPMLRMEPSSSETAKEVFSTVFDPSVNIRFHPFDLRSVETLENSVRHTELYLFFYAQLGSL